MKIGIIGSGRIGGNAARLFVNAGYDVLLSFSTDANALKQLATSLGGKARTGSVEDAVNFGEVVFFSVPWSTIPLVIEQAGSFQSKIVIDTTNQFGANGVEKIPRGLTAAQFNQSRLPGARLVKAFNTLTARFQADAAGRPSERRAVLFLCGDDAAAKQIVAGIIRDAGFEPVDVGDLASAAPMEAPRRPGALYGEEYRLAEALAAVEALREGRPIPATPQYGD